MKIVQWNRIGRHLIAIKKSALCVLTQEALTIIQKAQIAINSFTLLREKECVFPWKKSV